MGARRNVSHLLHPLPGAEAEGDDPWAGEDADWPADAVEEPPRVETDSEDDEDILAPARALIVGFILVIPLWLVIGAVGYAVYRALS